MIPEPPAGTPVDRLGDPLPPGAIARFGTTRLHHGGTVYGVARFGDDIVSAGEGISHRGATLNFWNAETGRLSASAQLELPHAACSDAAGRFLFVASSAQPLLYERIDGGIRTTALPVRDGAVMDIAISRDGKTAAVLRNAGCEVDLYETSPARHLRSVGCSAPVPGTLAISDDGAQIAVGDEEGGLFVIDAKGKLLLAYAQPQPLRAAPSLAYLPGTKELIEARANGALARWLPKARRTTFQRAGAFEGEAESIAISDDGVDVLVGTSAGHADVTLLSASNGEKRWEVSLTGYASFGYSVTFDRSGRAVVGTGGGSVEHLDRRDGKPVRLFEGGEEDVNAVAFLDEDRVLSFGSHIELWSVASPKSAPQKPIADEDLGDFVVSAKGDVLVASTRRGIVKVRTKDWTRVGELEDLDGGFYGASADLKTMFLGTFGTFERIDTARMKKLPPLSGATEKRTPECVAVSADGSRVAAVLGEQKGRPRLYRWETATAAPAIQALFENDDRWACAFASNGALVVGTDLGTYVVAKDGKVKKVNDRSIWRVESDPKRPRVAFADTDEKIALLDVTTGAVREIGSHLDNVDELAFSPSGERLASASQDDSVVIWDVR